jgi:hypothetical protein
MANPKLLITAGCSFTQYPTDSQNWPIHLKNYLDCETLFLGQGAAGNDIISKKAIFYLHKSLQTYKPEEILLGVMWSGYTRKSFYFTKPQLEYSHWFYGYQNLNYANPCSIDLENTDLRYYITHFIWQDEMSKLYAKNFFTRLGAVIETLENILRVQWFCEKLGIKYFFSKYSNDALETPYHLRMTDPVGYSEIEHLYDLINWDEWLPIESAWSWAEKKSSFPRIEELGNHLSPDQNKEMTEKIIIPHLKSKGYIE